MEPADLSAFKEYVSGEAEQLENAMHEDLNESLAGCDPLLAEILDYALFTGGKRVRPLLAVLASRVCGRNDRELYKLAVSFEYLHVATLVHDDIIDNAAKRRGREAVGHKYGVPLAILAGDWLHARSMDLVGRHTGKQGLAIFCRATAGMVDGEFLQLRCIARPEVSEQDYISVIQRKTALLISSTCEIGALFSGAEKNKQEALAVYGQRLGTAFQVIDDLLDYQGDSVTTGKKAGNDFEEGKMTLPVIRALKAAGPDAREEMISILHGDRSGQEIFQRFSALVHAVGGFSSARDFAEQLIKEALQALTVFNESEDQESLAMLQSLAGYVLARKK